MEPSLNTIEFMSYLRSLDIQLNVKEGRLACTAPKGVMTEELKTELKARKAEILDFIQKHNERGTIPPISRLTPRPEYATPSSGQQRLWFLEKFDPGSAVYNIPTGLHFLGKLDHLALQQSLQEMIRRHESLRTSMVDADGVPQTRIWPAVNWQMERVSLLETPENERQQQLACIAVEQASRHFDLTSAPLLRACLVVMGETEHILLIVLHHICSDGWSLGVLADELADLYVAFSAGKPSPLPELAVQYADYTHWHRQYIEEGIMQSQIAFWRETLKGQLPTMDLPLDRPRPAVMTFTGVRKQQILSSELMTAVERFSIAENVTPFITLLAAFKLLLFRYTREPDVIVGSVTAGRSRPELEKLVGLFLNNLALRTDLSGDPSVRDLLARVRKTALDAFAHDEVPLDLLTQVLQPPRDLSRSPFFQVMFILQNFPLRTFELPDLKITPLFPDAGTARYDISVEAVKRDGGLLIFWEFNTDLFDSSTIEFMQKHYQQLVKSLIDSPESRISELSMLTDAELKEFSGAHTDTRTDYPREACLHECFERQAAKSPNAIAVRCGEVHLTYQELDLRANRVAVHLRKLGFGRGALAGIAVERSVEMVVALLGVLKAGGAYIPIDPEYPHDRIAYMLEDSGATVLVTQQHLLGLLPDSSVQTLCLDKEQVFVSETTDRLSPVDISANDLAYVIYTSGSTGKPKGVEITHRSVVNFLTSMQREPGISAFDRLLAVTTLSFDIAGLELYLPLSVGAQVIIAPRADVADGVALSRLLQQSGATILQATPVTWRLLLESGWKGTPGLKILCGGEALPRDLADRLLSTGSEVWNLYGPTETTIWSSLFRVRAGTGAVPIGKPIANTQIYILDENKVPVPAGVVGELFIGGDGLARSYLHRPELTNEKFVNNPFRAGEKLYRTGDLARRLKDGNFDCLGRLDHQIKLRGFRIELGEIETALVQLSNIRQAVVIVREDTPGDQRLCAYLILKERSAIDPKMLRETLLLKLPEYMVPSAFMALEAFPLTPNKKVDRKALPVPEKTSSVSAVYTPPRTEYEGKVAAIWQDLLRNPHIGVNDNFFDLGGHSLLVVQLQNRLRQNFNREISLVELFQRPTVASIAGFLNQEADQPNVLSGNKN